MNRINSLILRRMRFPLLVLLASYAVSILGLTLIPGVDAEGQPWRMSIFHAFYFVSYMASTIGFGEIPHAFSDAQRLWVTITIYLTVIAWFYSIGSIINLIRDPAFKHASTENRFIKAVKRLRSPFYIVCGYGDTGKALVRALTERGIQPVVLEKNQDNVDFLGLRDYQINVPALCGDVLRPRNLLNAGLKHPRCQGVVAITHNDHANLKAAITSKLLNPDLPVICRGESQAYEDNMSSFGADFIIDPFLTFADWMAMALRAPELFLLHTWLTGVPHSPLPAPIHPPKGLWVVCGYGRFGKAVYAILKQAGQEVRLVDANPENAPEGCIAGWGTEACTLMEAGIDGAVGVVAGTDVDANNLSIVMTARELNENLMVVIRQNRTTNRELFEAIGADLVVQPSAIVAREIRVLLTLPLLPEFLHESRRMDNVWAKRVTREIMDLMGDEVPDIWRVNLNPEGAVAVTAALEGGETCPLGALRRHPRNREQRMDCIPLMVMRKEEPILMPGDDFALQPGDGILFCGAYGVGEAMEWTLQNANSFRYVVTGNETPEGWIWNQIRKWNGS